MAKYVPGIAGADPRNKVGGIVFSRNRYGGYMRNRVSPVQPRTPAQVAQRTYFTYVSQYWRDTLSAADRAGWNQYAADTLLPDVHGEKKNRAGNVMFVRFNVTWLRMGGTLVTTPPVVGGEAPVLSLVLQGTSAAGLGITSFAPALLATDRIIVLLAAHAVPQSRNFFGGPFTYLTNFLGNAVPPIGLSGPGTVFVGQRWFLQVRTFQGIGKVSPAMRYHIDITV
jgi:hypothetical protein